MSNEKKICCGKCGKTFERTNDLKRHNDRKIACDLYINKVGNAVIESDIIESSVSHKDIKILNDKIDKLTDIVNNQSTQIATLLHLITDMKAPVSTPVLSSIVSMEQPKTNEPLSSIAVVEQPKTNEPLSSIAVVEQPKTNEPLSSIVVVEQPKTNPIKKVKKVKKQATEPKKIPPKFTYLPNTDDRDYADADQDPQQDICDELKTYLDNLQREKGDKKPPIQMIHDMLYFSNFGLFCDGDGGKIIIDDEYVSYFINKCETSESQEAYYSVLLKSIFNPELGIFLDKETNKIYHINELGLWDWSETTFINQVRCALFDTLGSAIANSAVAYKDHTSKLFAIKQQLNYDGSKSDEINERLLSFLKQCYTNFTWNK